MIYDDVIKVNETKSSMAEVYRVLRNNIEFAYNNSNVKSVLVTSTKNGEGKTTVAANLAVTMANSGKKTLLIDCNLNSPSLHRIFKIVNNIGLANIIKDEKLKSEAVIKTNYENLYVLTSGLNSERFSELLMSKKMGDFLKMAREKYDFVVVDTPALMERSDAQIISQYVDGCLLVIGSGEVNKEEARKTKELLRKVNAKILGAVLNKIEDTKKVGINIGADENAIVTEVEKVKEFKERFSLGSLKGGRNMRRKGVFARFFVMMMAVMMLSTLQPGMVSAKASNLTATTQTENQGFFYNNQTNGDISIRLSGDEINVSVINNKYNDYGDMVSAVQIWGSNGGKWVLIKDFGTQSIGKSTALDSNSKAKPLRLDYMYTWDLKTIDTKNESYYKGTLKENTGEYKVYVKYNSAQNKYQEKFKTFYLNNNLKDQSNIITSFDMGNGIWNSWYSTNKNLLLSLDNNKSELNNNANKSQLSFNKNILDFIKNPLDDVVKYSSYPVVAKQYDPFLIFSDMNDAADKYILSIKGDNSYTRRPIDISHIIGRNLWMWVPMESGIFNIVMENKDRETISTRKIYVNSWNNGYLQLQDLAAWKEDEDTHVGAKIADGRPIGFNTNVNKSMRFVISEPYVWSKTIVDYQQEVKLSSTNEHKGYYYINENNDNNGKFEFGKGNYSASAYVKSDHSIEFEDARAINIDYRDSSLNGLNKPMIIKANDKDYSEGAPYDKDTTFTFTIDVTDVTDDQKKNLEYAFFKWDARGKNSVDLIQEYSPDKITYTWQPADSGEYIIYGRVRQKTNESDRLPNSYEKEIAMPVKITDKPRVGNITISHTKIDNNIINSNTINNRTITDHQMHYIDIAANYSNENLLSKVENINESDIKEKEKEKEKDKCPPTPSPTAIKDRLMYKAYATHDGVLMALNDYSPNNIIPFYPKSVGEYKILVLVKDSLSGSEEDRQEYTINVN